MLNFIAFLLLIEFRQYCSGVEFFSEHGKLCNASFSPNLQGEPLEKCGKDLKECKNSNNYYCEGGYCCPKKEFVCQSLTDSGHEIDEQKQFLHFGRFSYNSQLKGCIKFSYFGKGGNFNNFLKYSDCKLFCSD